MESGGQIESYTVIEEIGRGGQATVWSAWDSRRELIVALKIVNALTDVSSVNLEREAHLLISLNHPHILPLYEVGTTGSSFFFATRYVSLGTLSTVIDYGQRSVEYALNFIGQI